MSDWIPCYSQNPCGGWDVTNLIYPSGGVGRVSNEFPDSKWRIVVDDRRRCLGEEGDHTFASRDDAAHAERSIVERLRLQVGPTPRELESEFEPRRYTTEQIERLYEVRNAYVASLKIIGYVTIADLHRLDRLGRFRVADECWFICSPQAREALLADQHPHVRSAAVISKDEFERFNNP